MDKNDLVITPAIKKFIAQDERDHIFYIIGPKGIGKTFLLNYKRIFYQQNIRSKNIKPDDSKEEIYSIPRNTLVDRNYEQIYLSHEKLDLLKESEAWATIWKLSISLSIIKHMIFLYKPKYVEEIESRTEILLKRYRLPDDIKNIIKDEIIFSPYAHLAEILKLNYENTKKIIELQHFISEIIRFIHSGVTVYIDNVDQSFDRYLKTDRFFYREVWFSSQIGLIIAIYELTAINSHIKVFTTIRKEAFQRMKEIRSTLQLTSEIIDIVYTKNDLRNIFIKNIMLMGSEHMAFPGYVKSDPIYAFLGMKKIINVGVGDEHEDLFNYIYRHTLKKPRDLMVMGKMLSELEILGRNEENIRHVINTAGDLIAASYLHEIKPFSDIDNFGILFGLVHFNILTRDELVEICMDYNHQLKCNYKDCKNCDRIHVFCDLYKFGLLGVLIKDQVSNIIIQRFLLLGDTSLDDKILPFSKYYFIHPVLNKRILEANQLQGYLYSINENIIIGDDYPWEEDRENHIRDWKESLKNDTCKEIEFQGRLLFAKGDYIGARRTFSKIPKDLNDVWGKLEDEFGFTFDFKKTEEEDLRSIGNIKGQIEWRRKVWASLVLPDSNLKPIKMIEEKVKNDKNEIEKNSSVSSTLNRTVKGDNRDIGNQFEIDILKLLRHLFAFENDKHLEVLRRQKPGIQNGHDIQLKYCTAANNENVICFVECKGGRVLSWGSILERINQAEQSKAKIDHWILIAPRAGPIANDHYLQIDEWNAIQRYPFKINIWTRDENIDEFFGLEPDVYDKWIDQREGEIHPKNWTKGKREEVKRIWLNKLAPWPTIPKEWADYINANSDDLLFIDKDHRDSLIELWKNNEYIEFNGLDSSHSPLPTPLYNEIRKWLKEKESRVCVILGEFGDGKTAFTYMLSRRLKSEFRQNPTDGWIPVRFPLHWLSRINFNARNLLENRLAELKFNVYDWKRMVEKRNIIVILDGMDEITAGHSPEKIQSAFDILIDCVNKEFERVGKIIITCRTQFFEESLPRPYMRDRLNEPRIYYIKSFEKSKVLSKLEEKATSDSQRRNFYALKNMNDPISLGQKPLFLKMLLETLDNPPSEPIRSEIDIYQTYIDNVLTTERIDSFRKVGQYLGVAEIKERLLEILDNIAIEIHLSPKQYICLRNKADDPKMEDYARFLWQIVENDMSAKKDALNRIAMRSLLHKETDKVDALDIELWPVDFCHRSIREYFVARRVESALRSDSRGSLHLFSEIDLNYEIMRFVAELMKANQNRHEGIYKENLLFLVSKSRVNGNLNTIDSDSKQKLNRLGRMSATLLYKWLGELPGDDWSNLMLDGAQFPWIDLTKKNFQNSSLRSANLSNAILIDADFRNADLTGVRLEETGEISSIAVPQDLDGFFAAYCDGSIRRWKLADFAGEQSEIVYQSTRDKKLSFRIAALPGDGLCVYDDSSISFLNKDIPYSRVSIFDIKKKCLNMDLKDTGITITEILEDSCKVRIYDFSEIGLPREEEIDVDKAIYCERLGNKGLVLALEDGRIKICKKLDTENGVDYIPLKEIEFADLSSIASFKPLNEEEKYLLAFGGKTGSVGLWKIQLTESNENKIDLKEIFLTKIINNSIVAISFYGQDCLLVGGSDGKIVKINLLSIPPKIDNTFFLRLNCRGMKIDGIKSERERKLLQDAIGKLLDP